jgi:predicted ester cyclase
VSTDPRDVVREYCEAAFVRHDLDGIREMVTTDALVNAARGFVIAFPDIEMRFEHTATDNDWVAVGVSASATHLDTFQGHEPTGKRWDARATA